MSFAFIVWLVDGCRRGALWLVPFLVLLSAGAGWYAATHLGIDADESQLISPDLPWRQREARFEILFPQNVDVLLVVIDGASADRVELAAATLTERLMLQHDLFKAVERPDASPFFRRNALLFLDTPELTQLAARLIAAQPMLGRLAADPSLRGLFASLRLATLGLQRGDVEAANLAQPFSAIAAALQSAATDQATTISWAEIFSDRKPAPQELRRFLLLRPVLDYADLQPGAKSSAAVRSAVAELGLTAEHGIRVRLTGPVALADDELASVKEGAYLSLGLSLVLVIGFLFLALRSFRLILVVLATLVAGLAWTAGFAGFAVGTLNVISIAFAVMFLGIAVDFAIQFTVRYRGERHRNDDLAEALRSTAAALGKPLALAAIATALGFLSFVPTDYRGVSELGVIAAAGMLIAVFLTFTLLPALLVIVRPAPEPEPVGFRWAAGIDRFLRRQRRSVLILAGALALLCIGTIPMVRFDFDPMHLRDRQSESVATLLDLTQDPGTTPYTLDALAPSPKAAAELAAKLAALPEVGEVRTLASFIPEDQSKKLAVIADLGFFLAPALHPVRIVPPPSPTETRVAAQATMAELRKAIATLGRGDGRGALADALEQVAKADDAALQRMNQALLPGLTAVLGQFREALAAGPVDESSIPPELRQDWVAADGETRVEIAPKGNVENNATLVGFTRAVQRVAPNISGTPLSIQESGATVARAFLIAGVSAVATISLVLLAAMRRFRDVALVLAPLALAALLTMASAVVVGLPLNFANVIALPLMLGIGVAFDIYFVTGWREGATNLLQSATARAILFSALTTTGAFGTLALSRHRGTAEMGLLLVMALGYALVTTLVFLPALLGPPPRPATDGRG